MATIVGVGPLDGSGGIDLWLRVAHVVRSTRPGCSFLWLGVAGASTGRTLEDAIAHEQWHLGLDADVTLVDPGWSPAAVRPDGGSIVLAVSARPPVDDGEDSTGDVLWPAVSLLARTWSAPVVAFAGAVADTGDRGVGLTPALVDYPDVPAFASAVLAAMAEGDRSVSPSPAPRSRATAWTRRR